MRLTVNLTQENYELLQKLAKGRGLSLSDALNEVVEEFRNRPVTIVTGPDGFPRIVGLSGPVPDARDAEAEDDLEGLRRAGMLK
jgi:hypothetical protein